MKQGVWRNFNLVPSWLDFPTEETNPFAIHSKSNCYSYVQPARNSSRHQLTFQAAFGGGIHQQLYLLLSLCPQTNTSAFIWKRQEGGSELLVLRNRPTGPAQVAANTTGNVITNIFGSNIIKSMFTLRRNDVEDDAKHEEGMLHGCSEG